MTSAVAAANDGYVIVTSGGRDDLYRVDVFSEKGKRNCKSQVESSYHYPQATFHQVSGHVVVAGIEKAKERHIQIMIYTKNGEFVRSIESDKEDVVYLRGTIVTINGRIASVYGDKLLNFKVLVV